MRRSAAGQKMESGREASVALVAPRSPIRAVTYTHSVPSHSSRGGRTTGQIIPLTALGCLDTACLECPPAKARSTGMNRPTHSRPAVSRVKYYFDSPRKFYDAPNLSPPFAAMLEKHGLHAGQLELEINRKRTAQSGRPCVCDVAAA